MVEAITQIDVVSRHTDRLPSLGTPEPAPLDSFLNVTKRNVQEEERFDAIDRMMRGNRGAG